MSLDDPTLQEILKTGVRSAAQGVAWLWDAYAGEIKEHVAGKLGKKALDVGGAAWERVDWRLSARNYRESMQKQYGTTRVIGKPEPISLEGIFTDVYILEKPTAFERYDIDQLIQQKQEAKPWLWGVKRVPGLDLMREQPRLFILGKPGAGKTTFLKHIVWQAAQGGLDKIPIFVSLKDLADSMLDLMPFIFRQFTICQFPDAQPFVEHILEKGEAVVLFDALDEVQLEKGQRDRIIDAIKDFCQQYDKSPCLITCRIAAVEYTFEQFKYVELADFTQEQVEIYVRKWFKDDDQDCLRFFQQLDHPRNRRIKELASVPLQLSMLCLVFEETRDFPQRRVEIYQEALEALLKKWDAQRKIKRDEIYRELSPKRREQVFAYLAAQNFAQGDFFIKQEKLERQLESYLHTLPNMPPPEEIDSSATLKAIEAQHGILTERAARVYSFTHLSFQEYFTARYIVSDTTGRSLRGLLTAEHIKDSRWHEVILNTVSLLDNADTFFELFLDACGEMVAGEPEVVALLEWAEGQAAARGSKRGVAARALYCLLNLDIVADDIVGAERFYDALFSDAPLEVYYIYDADTFLEFRAIVSDERLAKIGEELSADALIDSLLVQAYHLVSFLERERDDPSRIDYLKNMIPHMNKIYGELFPTLLGLVDRSGDKDLALDVRELISGWEWLITSRLGNPDRALKKFVRAVLKNGVPAARSPAAQGVYSDLLLSILRERRQIELRWGIATDRRALNTLGDYFRSNILLLACLSLAAVTNRQAIKNSMLLPPRPA